MSLLFAKRQMPKILTSSRFSSTSVFSIGRQQQRYQLCRNGMAFAESRSILRSNVQRFLSAEANAASSKKRPGSKVDEPHLFLDNIGKVS